MTMLYSIDGRSHCHCRPLVHKVRSASSLSLHSLSYFVQSRLSHYFTEFEPVLNIPALGAFLFIAIVFVWLQTRIDAITHAADERQQALNDLRFMKQQELQGTVDAQTIARATERYRVAVTQVETLRSVVPGLIRIVPPPSQSTNRARMDENIVAAKQFLDLDLEATSDRTNLPPGQQVPLPIWKVVLLAAVAVSQLGLLALLLNDPMSPEQSLF
jgi:K+-sensing histidine kinase KdpD